MKILLTSILSIAIMLVIISCADETNPQFRVLNNRSEKANVQLQTTGGNTININEVTEAQTTDYQYVAEGDIIVTAVIQKESVSPTISFFAAKDTRYTIVILSGIIPTLRVDRD